MSILGQILGAATTAPASLPSGDGDSQAMLILLVFTAVGVFVAVKFRAWEPASVVGPKRVPDHGGAAPLAIVMLAAIFVLYSTAVAYKTHRVEQWRAAGIKDAEKNAESLLTPRDYAVMSTLPPMLGFAAMLLGQRLLGRGRVAGLGLDARQAPRGVLAGVTGMLVIGPAVFWTIWISSILYHLIYHHPPAEHQLLKSLGESQDRGARLVLMSAAIPRAPLFEELLFRGHLQTLLRQGLMRMSAGAPRHSTLLPPVAADLSAALTPPPPPPGAGPMEAVPPLSAPTGSPLQPAAWHGWLAIIATSMVFAMLHPAWSWPPIFVLSLGLGYLYERTGNLWAPITVHLLFNSMETVMFLMRGH